MGALQDVGTAIDQANTALQQALTDDQTVRSNLAAVGQELADKVIALQAANAQHLLDVALSTKLAAQVADLTAQLAALQPKPTGPVPPLGDLPKLYWADEFDGTAVDTSRWTVRDGHVGGNESSICWARNVSVKDSTLIIQPKVETSTAAGKTRKFTSGYLDTQGKLAIPRGSFTEVKAKLPLAAGKSRGMWPAVWFRTLSATVELDCMEAWGTPSDKADTQGHYQTSVWPNTNSATNGVHGWAVSGQDLTQWHTYGMLLEADGSVTYYFDGKPVTFTMAGKAYSKLAAASWSWLNWDAVKDKLEIRLNLQVGQPTYYGDPDGSTDFSQSYQVDYVRVWTA